MLEWKSDELRVSRGWGVIVLLLIAMTVSIIAAQGPEFDLVIRNGTIYDGRGGPPVHGDVAILKDRIAAVGALQKAQATEEVDATGLAVAPGFINMLSWANESLIADGRSQSDIRQGVTLEVMGEGSSMGPLNADMKRRGKGAQTDIRYDVAWTTLAEYLAYWETTGV